MLYFLRSALVRLGEGGGAEDAPAKIAGLTRNDIRGVESDVRDSGGGSSMMVVGESSMTGSKSGDVKGEGERDEAPVGYCGWRSRLMAAATNCGKSKSEALGGGVILRE